MKVVRRALGNVRADARVEHRLHKTPVVVDEDVRAEILLHPATAVITSRRGTREHPEQDNGRSREYRDQAEDRCTKTVSFAGNSVGGGRRRRRDENRSAPSSVQAQIGARNAPPHVSRDQRRIRGAVSGESLSARAAAARTRYSLVEEAVVAQTSNELEAVATKLAQLFPARRCCLICP